MMDHCHTFKSLECSMAKSGVIVKIEDEELYDSQYDAHSETSTGYPMLNPEMAIKEERGEEDSYTRNEEMFEEEESPESSAGHYVKKVVVKHEKDEGAYGMADQQFEERISSPEPSPDYIVVKIKEEEEEEEPYGMDNQPPIGKGSRPQTRAGRERDSRVHRMSSKMVIDIDQLIRMVHDRPELYDPKVPSYADRFKKKKAWDEICAAVVPDWDLCSEKEKDLKAKEIQTRWRSLKDCFRRELTLQKKLERSGIPTNRRRKYVHYDGLLFLEPTMKLRVSFGSSAPPTSLSNNQEPVEILQSIDIERSASPTLLPPPLLPPPPPVPTPPAPKRNKKKAVNAAESEWETHLLHVMDTLKKKAEEKSDSDEIFLKSLLPFVKKVPEERKIDMQLSMMHVVKRFMEPLPVPQRHSNCATQIPPQAASKPSRRRGHQRPTSTQPPLPAVGPSHKPATPQPAAFHNSQGAVGPSHKPATPQRAAFHNSQGAVGPSHKPATPQPAAFRNSQEPEVIPGPQPSSSPSSSSSSINPSPQSHRDSPYYFDL